MRRFALTLLCLVGFSLSSDALAAKGLDLEYEADLPTAPSNGILLGVEVVDGRQPDRGAGSIDIGQVRSVGGIPFALENEGVPTLQLMHTWAEDTVTAAGYVPAPTATGAHLRVTVTDFWFDGYVKYELQVGATVELVDASGVVRATTEVEGSGTERVDWTLRELNKPVGEVLESMSEDVVRWTHSEEFGAGIHGGTYRPVTPVASAQPVEVQRLALPPAPPIETDHAPLVRPTGWQPPEGQPALSGGRTDRMDAVGALRDDPEATTTVLQAVFNDPHHEVRRKAWRVLRARVKLGVGDMDEQLAAVEFLAEHGEKEIRGEARKCYEQYGR